MTPDRTVCDLERGFGRHGPATRILLTEINGRTSTINQSTFHNPPPVFAHLCLACQAATRMRLLQCTSCREWVHGPLMDLTLEARHPRLLCMRCLPPEEVYEVMCRYALPAEIRKHLLRSARGPARD